MNSDLLQTNRNSEATNRRLIGIKRRLIATSRWTIEIDNRLIATSQRLIANTQQLIATQTRCLDGLQRMIQRRECLVIKVAALLKGLQRSRFGRRLYYMLPLVQNKRDIDGCYSSSYRHFHGHICRFDRHHLSLLVAVVLLICRY